MQADTQLANVYTDMAGIGNLRREASTQSDASKREVAQQFEGLFMQMMLKSMRDAVPSEGVFGGGQQMETYQQMHDQQLALDLSKTGSIGIADLVYRQLGGTDPEGMGTKPGSSEIRGTDLSMAQQLWGGPSRSAQSHSLNSSSSRPWSSPEEFVFRLQPAANAAARKLGTKPEAILAIAALETGWGSHVAQKANGNSSNNLFGIKADRSWQSDRVYASTLEFESGAMQRRQEPFRSYRTPEESVADFAQFIQENPRYRKALEKANNPQDFIEELHKAGYATDPNYSRKVNSVMEQLQVKAKGFSQSTDKVS